MEYLQATTVLNCFCKLHLGKLKGAEYGVDAFNLTLPSNKSIVCLPPASLELSPHPDINIDAAPAHQLKILCWNINGDLKAKMLCPDFINIITQYDICLLQETHLYPLEHTSLNIPNNFEVISLPRKYKRTFKKQFGGVITLFNRNLKVSLNKMASSADIMVLDLEHLTIINVYILPEYQTWDTFTDLDPFQRLQETLTSMRERNRPIIAMGDFNARTGLNGVPGHPCKSKDTTVSTRGRALAKFCATSNFILLNGTALFELKTLNFTSFQPRGNAVVDYVIVNDSNLDTMSNFEVLQPQLEWSDHAPLSVALNLSSDLTQQLQPSHHKARKSKFAIYDSDNPLDDLQRLIVQDLLTPEGKVERLYGHPHISSKTLEVHTDGSCLGNGTEDARAGAGVFWGHDSPKNLAVRVPGKQTNNHAEIFAIFMALLGAQGSPALKIFSDSVYAIKSLVDWAPSIAERAWKVENGDIIRDTITLIKLRPGPVSFVQIKGHNGNKHNEAADQLAKMGALLPPAGPYVSLDSTNVIHTVPPSSSIDIYLPKVTATYIDNPTTTNQLRLPSLNLSDISSSIPPHRGRDKLRYLKISLREKLLSSDSDKSFWKTAKMIMNGKEQTSPITADELKEVFEKRMNPLNPIPETFDTNLLNLNIALAKAIPKHTQDKTQEHFFSKLFSVEEMASAKLHLEKRRGSATGIDGIGYQEILEIDNSALCNLLNLSMERLETPSSWLSTVIVAIIKRGKPRDDPNNYRAIGLESCLLKLMTLLIHIRLTAWCEKYNLLPPSQNGFRNGYRTNNNTFILRCAVDRARAEGNTLFVMFADISNAFPSTEQSTLWLKLRSLGAGGMIFDWIRMVYERMDYIVSHNSETSEVFKSIIGILIGDTCSPILWNIYLADIKFLISGLDIKLDGCHISHLEQADDILLMSTTAKGLQDRMNVLSHWCSKNFMVLNSIKSAGIILGPIPNTLPSFNFGSANVAVVERQTYIGLTIVSTNRNIFKEHYDIKAGKAKNIGNMILATQSVIGKLPPWELRKLYMALMDPHLTHGAEISLDINPDLLEKLEDIQHLFLCRLLDVGEKCMNALLFTETAVLPIKYRRIITALNYLKYLLQLPSDMYAAHAMRDSISLALMGKPCWVMDILYVIKNLPFEVDTLNIACLTPQKVDDTMISILLGLAKHLQQLIDNSPKSYLLTGRKELNKKGKPIHKTLYFRHYLNIDNYKHRRAITRIVLSCHSLAVERLRWRCPTGIIPRSERLCRFCRQEIETPEHALLECKGNTEILNIREKFTLDIALINTNLLNTHEFSLTQCLKNLIGSQDTISRVSQLAYDVLEIFDTYPIYVPSSPVPSQ